MTNEQKEKYKRLQDRLKELSDLYEKIGKLSFYINTEKENGNEVDELLNSQLGHMLKYATELERRICQGVY
ncbi:hypothetical protein WKS98_03290 [Lagierella sp. ICN-221743]